MNNKENLKKAHMGKYGYATRDNQKKAFNAIINALLEIIERLEKLEKDHE